MSHWHLTAPVPKRTTSAGWFPVTTPERRGDPTSPFVRTWHRATRLASAFTLDCGEPLPQGWPTDATPTDLGGARLCAGCLATTGGAL